MKKSISLMITVLIFIFFLSCGGENTQKNDSESQNDEEISETENEPDEEAVDEEQMSSKPEDEFYEKKLNLIIEFNGMINSLEDALNGDLTDGKASVTLTFNEHNENAFSSQPFVYQNIINESSSFPEEYVGKNVLLGGVFSDNIIQENGFTKYRAVYFGLITDLLKQAKENKTQEISMDNLDSINYLDIQYKKRADNVVVRRNCMLAMKKKNSACSKYFIDFSGSGNYEPGDNLHFFANLELEFNEEKIKEFGYVEDSGMLCKYKLDSLDITKEEYEVEVEKSGIELSCDMPEEFNNLPADNYVDILFKGDISSPENLQKGLSKTTFLLHGENMTVDDYQSNVYLWTDDTEGELIIVESMGGVKVLEGNDHLEYKVSRLIVPRKTLATVFSDGKESCHIVYSEENDFFYNYDVDELKTVDGISNVKACTRAIPAKEYTFFDLFLCTKDNTDFSVGEAIEMRAVIDISDDEDWIKELYEVDDIEEICVCYNNSEVFDCKDFETLGE